MPAIDCIMSYFVFFILVLVACAEFHASRRLRQEGG